MIISKQCIKIIKKNNLFSYYICLVEKKIVLPVILLFQLNPFIQEQHKEEATLEPVNQNQE